MSNGVDRADLSHMRDQIIGEMRHLFEGVYERQDRTNGRLLVVEAATVRHDERIRTIFRIFDRRKVTRDPSDIPPKHRPSDRRLTERDLKIVIGTLLAASGMVTFVMKVVPFILKVTGP